MYVFVGFFCNFANAMDWNHLLDNGDQKYYVSNVRKNEDKTVSIFIKQVIDIRKPEIYKVALYSFNCDAKKAKGKTIKINEITKEGSREPMQFFYENHWNIVRPKTATYKIMQYACGAPYGKVN